jgi:hypothetical protein
MPGVLGDRGHHQEHIGQRHPAVPGAPAADLVLVQAAQPLAGLQAPAPPASGPRPLAPGRSAAGRPGRRTRSTPAPGAPAAAQQQPAAPSVRHASAVERQAAPRVLTAALGPWPALLRSQHAGPIRSASRAADVDALGPHPGGSGSVALTASTYGIPRVSSQPRSAGLPRPARVAASPWPARACSRTRPGPGMPAAFKRGIVDPALGRYSSRSITPCPAAVA